MSPVADVDGDQVTALLGALAGADGEDLALLGLLLGGVGDDQAGGGGLFGLAGLDDDPILEGLKLHVLSSVSSWRRAGDR